MKPRHHRSQLGLLPLPLLLLLLFLADASGAQPGTQDDAQPGADATAATVNDGYDPVRALLSESRKERRRGAKALAELGDRSLLPGAVDALFFLPHPDRLPVQKALEALAGKDPGSDYYDWVEWIGRHPELEPKPGYSAFKVELLTRIDPRYRAILYPGAPERIRLEEVVWGGVRLDGIPSIDRPDHLPAAEARGMRGKERVFGVAVGGEARAYPVRILSWNEMLNDVVGGVPVTLAYCTLCGAGVLYDTRTPSGEPYTFGTSGLLYRSNKLMYDRQSYTLWNQLTGEPVIGRRARGDVRLELLPVTVTTWEAWRERHPDTTVMVPGPEMEKLFDYRTGAADRARAGVAFPVWQRSELLPREEEVYALRVGGHPKAYPVERLLERGVVNDRLGDVPLVLVAEEGGAVRVYRRGELTFRRGDGGALVDDRDRRWRVLEEALALEDAPAEAEEGAVARLERIPGHRAFWFGWFGFYPETEVYGQEAQDRSS